MKTIVAANLTDLHREPSFLSEMLTQVLHGTAVEVLEEQERWCRVRLTDGYEGWAYTPYLGEAGSEMLPTHMVTSRAAEVRSEGGAESPIVTRVLAGTMLAADAAVDGWCRVVFAGGLLPAGWVASTSLRPLSQLPLGQDDARRHIVEFARQFMGIYYLWGGNTAWGTDCSGLVWLAHRLAGFAVPRDAHPQFHAGRSVEPPYPPGDLFFFRSDRDPERIGHVGISLGGWQMIHSSRTNNGVYEEDVQASGKLREGFAGARTLLK